MRVAVIVVVAALALVTLKLTVGSDQWVCQHITGGRWVKNDTGLGNGDAYGAPAMVAGAPDYSCARSPRAAAAPAPPTSPTPTTPQAQPYITGNFLDQPWPTNKPIAVIGMDVRLTKVLITAGSTTVRGRFSVDHTRWTSTTALAPHVGYNVWATGVGADGIFHEWGDGFTTGR